MSLRNGKTRNGEPIPKRSYKKRQQASIQSSNQATFLEIDQATSQSSNQATVQEESSFDISLDEYDRIVPKNQKDYYKELDYNNLQESDHEIVASKPKKSRKGQPKAAKYQPINNRSHIFESQAAIDTYIRTTNQFNCIITNNNLVKCSYDRCEETSKHKMRTIYRKCNCKQVECDLKYQYRHCDNVNEWQLFQIGNHKLVENHLEPSYGVPLQIIDIIEELLESNPDLKANDLLRAITKKRKKNERLSKELEFQLSCNPDYIPTLKQKKINLHYVFDKKLVPDLIKIQTYMNNRNKKRSENNIERIKEFIMKHQYNDQLADDEPFFFNLNFNDSNELILGDGKSEPLHIMITSKSLINYLKERGVGHIDATYKIMTTGYSLVIYGVTDIRGHLHPVAFMITSKEQEEDFTYFYSGLQDLCQNMNLDYKPRFIMQDHCYASLNAAKNVYPSATVLMCYFHVKLNIRKNLKSILGEDYDQFESSVTYLHYSTSEDEYNERLADFREKYKEYDEAIDYMNKQWFDSPFNNWQIYHNDPGYASTNSNMESFNATFKREYTRYFKCSILSACRKIFECVIDYGYKEQKKNVFHIKPAFDKNIKEKALKVEKTQFKKLRMDGKKLLYTGYNNNKQYTIRLDDTRCYMSCSCSCSTFIKWALCHHVVAHSILYKTDIYGMRYRQQDNFERKIKKGPKSGRFPRALKALLRE